MSKFSEQEQHPLIDKVTAAALAGAMLLAAAVAGREVYETIDHDTTFVQPILDFEHPVFDLTDVHE